MKLKITSLIIGLCLSVSIQAATEHGHDHETDLTTSTVLSLHEVVEKTYQRNPKQELIQARLNHIEALNRKSQSLWASDPTFNLNHYNDELMNSNGLQEWEVGMQMPLWLPGQKAARQKTVEREREVVNATESALKLEIAGIVRELLWHIALTKNRQSVAQKEWEIVQKLEQDVNKRVELGDLSESDLILAQQESLSKEAAFRMARQEYLHAQHRYEMITGLNQLPEIFQESADDDLSITTDHPALKESYEKVTHSTAQRDQVIIEKRRNPSMFIGTRHERGMSSDSFANAIGLNFSIPLGLSSHTTPKLTAAEINLSENRSQMEALHLELNIAIQDASRELSSVIGQYEFAHRQNELSKRNLAMSRKAFSLGESSLLDMIRIQAQAFAAERTMHQKQLEVGLYTARLNQAKGLIP